MRQRFFTMCFQRRRPSAPGHIDVEPMGAPNRCRHPFPCRRTAAGDGGGSASDNVRLCSLPNWSAAAFCEGPTFGPGWRGPLAWKPHSDGEASWNIEADVRANGVALGREVALKILPNHFTHHPNVSRAFDVKRRSGPL